MNNWSQDKPNTSVATSIPGQGTDVIFAIDSATGAVATTLEQNSKINSLTFEAGTSTPTSVSIAPGAVTTNRLEIAPQASTDGIAITAGGPPAVTISAPLKLGASQTWNVTDAASVLTLSGGLLGEADVTKSGAGRVILSAAADPTFNLGATSDFTVTGGNLEFTNSAALGTTANGNLANVIVSGGGFYYNNATAATLPHAITLSGGTLSGGGANHTYSGTVNVSAASTINMADSNTALTGTARNITLSGVVSGSGNLTIDGNNTASGGNQLGGTLTMNNAGNTWSGDLLFNRGTVLLTSATSPLFTTNDVTFNSFGRLQLQSVNGSTLTRTGALSYAAGAVGEFSVDNTSGTLGANYLVNQNGAVTLGAAGTGASMRVFLADTASAVDITGGVTLGGTSSISVAGGDADSFLNIPSIIGDGGSGYGLNLNDDAGGWGATNTIIRLTGANTFTGNVLVDSGTVQFDTITNISGGASSLGNGTAITMGASTLAFIGSTSQSTDRPITTTGSITLSNSGNSGATITYNGPITQATDNALTLAGPGSGTLTGGVTQLGTAADLSVSSGTWNVTGTNTVADDVIVTGATSVLNLNSTGTLAYTAGTSNGLYARTGATINLNANDVNGVANSGGLDFILINDNAAGTSTLATNGNNITTPRLDLGQTTAGYIGNVTGAGTVTVTYTGTDYAAGIRLFEGAIDANLAGVASMLKQGTGVVTLRGDNSGLASTVAATRIDAGNLILDFTANNAAKLSSSAGLDMRGATLTLNGNNTAATSQTVASFTLANGGSNLIDVNAGTGQTAVLNLNAITRVVNAQDGTVRFDLPIGTQDATNGITTDTLNNVTGANGILGGWATVNDGTGTYFARNLTNAADGNIVAATTTLQDSVAAWLPGENISDSSGFTGTLGCANINSLRFNAAAGSDLAVATGGMLKIASGGILVTDQAGGTPSITGGTLASGAIAANVPELMITQDSASTFEIGADIRVNHMLTKTGTGTLLLSGNNVYTGNTEIQSGTVQVSGGSGIGDSSLVTLADDKASTLQLLANETIGRLQGGSRAASQDFGTVAIGSNTLTINQSASTTYAGFITGNGSLVMNAGNTGNLNLTNVSTGFSGSVVVSGGLFQLSGIGQIDASSFIINKGGNLLIDNNGTTRSGTRILDSAAITLNSADGGFSGATVGRPRGLTIRTDQDATLDETVGVITAASGASYAALEATTTNDDSDIIASNILRTNSATLNVRGTNLGTANAQGNQLRIGNSANETTFIGTLVGGGGAAATQNNSIVRWAIGETLTGALADTNMGNSLVTYVAGAGFRPLDFATEYDTLALAAATDNARESLTADLTGIAGTTVNSLVLNNNTVTATAVNVTGTGAVQTLAVTSGAMLFTLNNAAAAGSYGLALGGFDSGITVGGANEYVIHVVNPSSAAGSAALTTTISSPLTSTADITKSGRGTLVLNQVNTAGGGTNKTTLNEGILEIADLDYIGGNTGNLVFAGGTLRVGTGFADDLSGRTITFLSGGGTLDTNGVDLTLAGSLGSGAGGFT